VTFVAPPFEAAVFDQLLKLNNDHAEELSFKTPEAFAELLTAASFVRAETSGLALLVAFNETCIYDNPNFAWLKARYARFNYIDRVVVSAAARGQGLARQLYEMLETVTRADGRARLVCEINLEPPNPQSEAFHESLGFGPVGQQVLPGGAKTVRYWAKEIDSGFTS
jgi:uncharacterized protein